MLQHVEKVGRDWGASVQVLAELRFDLPSTYSFHRRASQDIEVDLVRFTIGEAMTIAPSIKTVPVALTSFANNSDSKNERRKDKTAKSKGKPSRR